MVGLQFKMNMIYFKNTSNFIRILILLNDYYRLRCCKSELYQNCIRIVGL